MVCEHLVTKRDLSPLGLVTKRESVHWEAGMQSRQHMQPGTASMHCHQSRYADRPNWSGIQAPGGLAGREPPPCWFSHNLARHHRQPAHLRAPFFFFPDGGLVRRSVGDDNRDFIKKPMLTARNNKCGEAARNRQIIGQSPQRGVCVSSDRPRLSDGLPHDGGEAASTVNVYTLAVLATKKEPRT